MTFRNYKGHILVRVLLLTLVLCATAYLVVTGYYAYLVFMVPIIIYLVVEFIRYQGKTHEELQQFVESVHYRDFSRYFDVKHAPMELQPLREGFNEINTTFKVISKEKETQYQYLQKILELVDTGILSFHEADGEVVWMNESLKRMLQLPYLKTIGSLQKRDAVLYENIMGLQPGSNKVVTVRLEKQSFKVLLSATAFQTDGRKFKLVAFQNINEALDETEANAWRQLLSVLTHEIMNSVAPISSLADTLKHRLVATSQEIQIDSMALEDLELGIETIKRRSEGLLKFAETYRSLNKITTLHLHKVHVSELFANLHQLMQPTFEQKGIELEIILRDPAMTMQADPSLLEQVLINLIVNAIEAVKDITEPKIILSADQDLNKKITLRVADNGHGMPTEVLDKIFIPFFSTKKHGSGIGISLCKQIMMLHKGNIQVQSKEGVGTAFVLHF
jgi:two-component system, NtrC family, nitrogen regulation sensor histidine kinase NtrY